LNTSNGHQPTAKALVGFPRANLGIGLDVNHPGNSSAQITGIAIAGLPNGSRFFPGPPACWPKEVLASLSDPEIRKVGYGLKRDILLLSKCGIEVHGGLFDVAIANTLITGGRHRVQDECSALAAKERALTCLHKQDELCPQLQGLKLTKSFHDVEMPLIPVLAAMEREGIRVDKDSLLTQRGTLANFIEATQASVNALAGRGVDLDSLQDVGKLLFEQLRINDKPRKTRTGQYATDADTLQAVVNKHPVVQQILDYRERITLLRGYLEQLPEAINSTTGRIHTTFESNDTATGRLSSKNPNLQNIPIRSALGREIRKAFLSKSADYLLLSADYSQIELRVLASLSREESLIAAFLAGDDIHSTTAARVFGTTLEKVTAEMRAKAKMVNYGISYGMSADGLAHRLGISRTAAAEFIDQYFENFPGLRRYMRDIIKFARKNGFIQTMTGRRRYLAEINASNINARKAAQRNAINSPIQGTAAEMIKLAMVNIHRELKARHLRSRLLLQVHDELVLDVYRPEKMEVTELVAENMKTALRLEVPVAIFIGTGSNWLEAH